MTYDDFLAEFRAMTIAEIDDDASYVYKSAKDPELKGVYFRVTVPKQGQYSFQVDKTPERIYPDQYQSVFRYPEAHIELGKLDGEQCHRVQGLKSKRRTLFKKVECTEGVYIAWVRIAYNNQFEKEFDVNLALYAEYACNVEFASHEEAVIFSGDPNIDWEPPMEENNKPWNNMGNNDLEDNGWGEIGDVDMGDDDGWEFW